ncbi:MAG: hypothetical protein QOK10_2752, partial [Pseudonocardiales bacterium]|nr:hypothetical protein [Pseudonocardiales bacterium]
LVRRTRLDHDGELDALLDGLIATSPTMRWAIGHGRFAMGASTPRAFIAAFLDYNLRDGDQRIQFKINPGYLQV